MQINNLSINDIAISRPGNMLSTIKNYIYENDSLFGKQIFIFFYFGNFFIEAKF